MNKVEHAEESPCIVRSKLNSLTMWEVGGVGGQSLGLVPAQRGGPGLKGPLQRRARAWTLYRDPL